MCALVAVSITLNVLHQAQPPGFSRAFPLSSCVNKVIQRILHCEIFASGGLFFTSVKNVSQLTSYPFFLTYQQDKSTLPNNWKQSWERRYDTNRMKTTQYFEYTRKRSDRASIKDHWIEFVINNPTKTEIQADGRIKKWVKILEAEKYLRVVLLEDGETVHNAFFDRSYKED